MWFWSIAASFPLSRFRFRVERVLIFTDWSLCVPFKGLPCLAYDEAASAPVPWSCVDLFHVEFEFFLCVEECAAWALEFSSCVPFFPVEGVFFFWHCFSALCACDPSCVFECVCLCGYECCKASSADCAVSLVPRNLPCVPYGLPPCI